MKVKEIIKLCQHEGWYPVSIKGSHRHFKHPLIPGKITVPGWKLSKEMKPGTQHQILKKLLLK